MLRMRRDGIWRCAPGHCVLSWSGLGGADCVTDTAQFRRPAIILLAKLGKKVSPNLQNGSRFWRKVSNAPQLCGMQY
ncbi:hypothetical protein MPL1032_30126 [Mesorhizobium plurifarium]|uniref:Uncharacterized protein n=1 Tax=Mesorhizobium plurifarium TaxID=69974 RepID=A0A0K2W2T1_MESPL|nr:hypothetical protein MPL1032_30126 [Mesorhizobium plurifarium]